VEQNSLASIICSLHSTLSRNTGEGFAVEKSTAKNQILIPACKRRFLLKKESKMYPKTNQRTTPGTIAYLASGAIVIAPIKKYIAEKMKAKYRFLSEDSFDFCIATTKIKPSTRIQATSLIANFCISSLELLSMNPKKGIKVLPITLSKNK
jgi:hypothetical protein